MWNAFLKAHVDGYCSVTIKNVVLLFSFPLRIRLQFMKGCSVFYDTIVLSNFFNYYKVVIY